MARTVGSKNKDQRMRVSTSSLPVEARMQLVASLIVDKISDDQQSGHKLLKKLRKELLCETT